MGSPIDHALPSAAGLSLSRCCPAALLCPRAGEPEQVQRLQVHTSPWQVSGSRLAPAVRFGVASEGPHGMGKHDAGPSAGCVAMLVGALALALTCHLVSVGRGPLGGPGALPQRFPLAFARPMRQRVATETPPTQEKVVDLLPIGRMNDTTRLRPTRAHSTGLSELTPRSTQSAFESLMERRAGVCAGGPEPRPGWLADTVLVTAANWNYMQMLKNWDRVPRRQVRP